MAFVTARPRLLAKAARLAAVVTTVLLAGCGGDEPAPDVEQPAPASEAARGDEAGHRAAADEPAEPIAPPPAFLYRRGPRVLPHDYAIGPLQDLLVSEPTEQEVTAVLIAFFETLAAGSVRDEAVAADRRQSLSRSLQFHLRDGRLPHAVRIGAITSAEDHVRVAFRLFGDPGRASGEAYLQPTAAGWRIVDLQLDLQQLAQPYTARAEFEPRADRWLLLDS